MVRIWCRFCTCDMLVMLHLPQYYYNVWRRQKRLGLTTGRRAAWLCNDGQDDRQRQMACSEILEIRHTARRGRRNYSANQQLIRHSGKSFRLPISPLWYKCPPRRPLPSSILKSLKNAEILNKAGTSLSIMLYGKRSINISDHRPRPAGRSITTYACAVRPFG